MDLLYLDHAATTPVLPAVWETMRPYLADAFGNPASAHRAGRRARQGLEDAREQLADILGARPDEVVFTSGATEANNLAVFGLAGTPPGHLLVSAVEHPSVSEPAAHLARSGFTVGQAPVDAGGVVRTGAARELVRPGTRLVAVMLANHETGAVQPVADLRAAVPDETAFHCDAVQAVGKMPVHFHDLGVATLSLSAHKFHGPKGVGALLVRRGTRLEPRARGGHQQQGRRPGTEPVALAVGMAVALDLWRREADERVRRVRRLREVFLDGLRSAEPLVINGDGRGLPHLVNVSFPGCPADLLLVSLDLAGVACATGSACSSGSLLPSPVLQAMAVPDAVLRSAMRFSLSHLLTETEVMEAARRIGRAVCQLRSGS